jgi:hypothetical protein
MLSWSAALGYGAAGGLIMEVVVMWRQLQAWQQARHRAMSQGKPRPDIKNYIDPAPDLVVALTRTILGCAAGLLLHTQVTGIYAALTVGASAPALLASLGKATAMAEVPTTEALPQPSTEVLP